MSWTALPAAADKPFTGLTPRDRERVDWAVEGYRSYMIGTLRGSRAMGRYTPDVVGQEPCIEDLLAAHCANS
ncbi:hypothetical protein [Streptomyces sp. A1547]|uniref:hypothetical protein n=1 Tax=Streptomyces sp. A1547 TaxID=2563105 RepID=UPI00144AF8DB|nr:hypothetical protein [Streptomyces sp. A1547]